jgi:hypothetical protein
VAKKDRPCSEVEQHVRLDARTALTRDHSAEPAERDWVVSQLSAIEVERPAVLAADPVGPRSRAS